MDELAVAKFMGHTESQLDSLGRSIDTLRATLIQRTDTALAENNRRFEDASCEINRRFEEHRKSQEDSFRSQGVRLGDLERRLTEHLISCKNGHPESSWRDKKVAIGAGGGAGLMGLIQLIRHLLEGG